MKKPLKIRQHQNALKNLVNGAQPSTEFGSRMNDHTEITHSKGHIVQ